MHSQDGITLLPDNAMITKLLRLIVVGLLLSTPQLRAADAAPQSVVQGATDRLLGEILTHKNTYDIAIEGISLAVNFRGQFGAEIKRSGLDALIARLESASTGTTAAGSGG